MEIHRTARKHGIADEDIVHGVELDDGGRLAIHAMRMRASYIDLLPEQP